MNPMMKSDSDSDKPRVFSTNVKKNSWYNIVIMHGFYLSLWMPEKCYTNVKGCNSESPLSTDVKNPTLFTNIHLGASIRTEL